MEELIANIEKLCTTELGAARVRRNLRLNTDDVVRWCRERITESGAVIRRAGTSSCISTEGCRITENAHSYTVFLSAPGTKNSGGSKYPPLCRSYNEV